MASAALAPLTIGMSDSLIWSAREELADDLHFVEEALREQRAAGTIAKARREDFFFGRTAFALEVAARKTAGGGVFFAIIDGEGKPVLTGFGGLRDAGGDEDIGFADVRH